MYFNSNNDREKYHLLKPNDVIKNKIIYFLAHFGIQDFYC